VKGRTITALAERTMARVLVEDTAPSSSYG
jgi:hypothetical protein